jgi:endonuclease YncB( thermonuclease family)
VKRRFVCGRGRLLLAAFFLLPAVVVGISRAETAVVEAVTDGDTLRVLVGTMTATVRLIGIDAPERSHPSIGQEFYGNEAAAFLSTLCLGKTVRMEKGEEESDRYDRLLRYVFLPAPDDRLLNLEMIRAGMARAYSRYPFSRREEFLAAESLAREEGKGIWKDGGAASGGRICRRKSSGSSGRGRSCRTPNSRGELGNGDTTLSTPPGMYPPGSP